MEVKNVVCYSNSMIHQDAMAYLRIIGPFRQAGINIINGLENGKSVSQRVSDGDIVVVQREFPNRFDDYQKIVNAARREGKPIVFDLDDLLFFLPENHPDRQSQYYASSLLPMFQALMEADLVTVSTPKLQNILAHCNDNVVVLPNYFDETLWQLRPPFLKSKGEILTIGFMGGNSHRPDIEYVLPVLLDLIKHYPQHIRFHFWGLQPPAEMLSLPQVEWTPPYSYSYKDFSAFFQTQSADIFIGPLVVNRFNRCKSPLKFFEYTALGAPSVLSRLATYTGVVTHGHNGLLASSLDEWTDCLIQLIENDELRLRLATNAQLSIRANWLLSQNAFRWQDAFQNLSGVTPRQLQNQERVVQSINVQLLEKSVKKDAEILALTSQITEKEQNVQVLLTQMVEKDADIQALTTRVVERGQFAQAISTQLVEKDADIQALTTRVVERGQFAQAISTQLAEKEAAVQDLTNLVAEKEQSVQILSTQIAEINNSRAWEIALFFRRIRVLLAPPNSRRARVLQRSINSIFVPFMKIKRNRKLKEDLALIRSSGLFDETWYLTNNPDVVQAKVNPLLHYLRHGGLEGRDPGPNFCSDWYLNAYEDVKKSGINPLVHYLKFGREEGRHPNSDSNDQSNDLGLIKSSGLFDENWYLTNNPDVAQAKVDPLIHYLYNGGFEGRDPGPNFSSARYLDIYKDIQKSGINPLVHYLKYGKEIAAQPVIPDSISVEYIPIADEDVDPETPKVKLIAFYLPQFYPIPENDEWWGKGFTEWANVSKAVPNFKGHYQPHLPGELGFYDLRIPEVQKRQIELAKKYGVYGFCYYYYWFNGRRLLERPLNQILENPDLDFPFCVCWANENWTRRWDGAENEILIGQAHTEDEYLDFIQEISPILKDNRYICVEGKPLLAVYRVNLLPNPKKAAEIWRSECKKMGIGDIYLAAVQGFGITDPRPYGFDAAIEFPPHHISVADIDQRKLQITNPSFSGRILDYQAAAKSMICKGVPDYTLFKTVMPSWDNTARKQNDGHIFINSTPQAYKDWLVNITKYTRQNLPKNKRFVFINAWNEWAEGTYLEPDRMYGYAYLQATAEAITSPGDRRLKSIPGWTILFVSHDAGKGGAQAVLLNTITWFKKHTALSLKILCLEGGELLTDFQKLADTVVLNELQRGGIDATEEDLTNRLLEFCGETPDLIYGNTVVSGKAYQWLSKLGVPILTHVHEMEMSIQHYAAEWMGDVLEYSTHFLACSGVVRDNLIRNHGVPAERISVGYASIFRDPFVGDLGKKDREELKKNLDLIQDKHLIFGCGLGMPFRKGADLFIKLGEILQREGRDDFHLYWIGGFDGTGRDKNHGVWSDYLKHLEQSGLNKFVTFLGYKKNPRDYLKVGDVFVLPSREEPFALVALEAADYGLPTICFENSGTADFVGEDAGYIVPLEDVETMAHKLISLIEDEDLRRRLGTRAKEKLLANFTVDRTMPHILFVCRKIADKKPAVSVIVPNYNHAQYLPQRLDSIFNQTYQDFEVILIDDASTDNSLEVLERYANRGNVQIIKCEQNSGSPFKQWLKGFDLARADIWWIAESDDICDSKFLDTLLSAFKYPQVKLAYVNSHIIDEKDKVGGDYLNSDYLTALSDRKWSTSYRVPAQQEINEALGIKDTILNVSAVLFRRYEISPEVRETLERMRIAGDWYFIVHAIKDGEVYYDSTKLNFHRRHSESVIGKILREKKLGGFFQEFCMVQKYIFQNYKLDAEFQQKWEAYLRQQWNDFYPNRPFDELKSYYPFDEMRELILNNAQS